MTKHNSNKNITYCFLLGFLFLSLCGSRSDTKNYCPIPIINGVEDFGWNSHDQKTLQNAYKRCAQKYKNSPCVKVFNKIGQQNYTVICGRGK